MLKARADFEKTRKCPLEVIDCSRLLDQANTVVLRIDKAEFHNLWFQQGRIVNKKWSQFEPGQHGIEGSWLRFLAAPPIFPSKFDF
jgi:hypothetical protein